mmetsp:Transcript_85367/g.228307  ORF Transcript_85367/g.228307 Transcript_85367/m.228307 type:complete len:246 (+) Transcript_85367:3-740(+)
MGDLGVSTEFVQVGEEFATSVSHILLDPTGERAIIMAPASTGTITEAVFRQYFTEAVAQAPMVTTEISQVPLSGVHAMLDMARGVSCLDVDVPPSVASGDAGLGTLQEVLSVARAATVVKPTLEAASELLALAASHGESCDPAYVGNRIEEDLAGVASQLREALGAKLVAVTDGKKGCGLAALGPEELAAVVPVFPGVNQVDSTGAGDAFFRRNGGDAPRVWPACDHAGPGAPGEGGERYWCGVL